MDGNADVAVRATAELLTRGLLSGDQVFPQLVAPLVSTVQSVFVGKIWPVGDRTVGSALTAGHHLLDSRSVLGAVKARRFAPPA